MAMTGHVYGHPRLISKYLRLSHYLATFDLFLSFLVPQLELITNKQLLLLELTKCSFATIFIPKNHYSLHKLDRFLDYSENP